MQGFSPSIRERLTKQWKQKAKPPVIQPQNLVNKRHVVAAKSLEEKIKKRRKN